MVLMLHVIIFQSVPSDVPVKLHASPVFQLTVPMGHEEDAFEPLDLLGARNDPVAHRAWRLDRIQRWKRIQSSSPLWCDCGLADSVKQRSLKNLREAKNCPQPSSVMRPHMSPLAQPAPLPRRGAEPAPARSRSSPRRRASGAPAS